MIRNTGCDMPTLTSTEHPVYLIAPSSAVWFDAHTVEPAQHMSAPAPWPPVALEPVAEHGAPVGIPATVAPPNGLAVRTGVRITLPAEMVDADRVDVIDVPKRFTTAFGDAFCERIVDGETLHSICLTDGMPDRYTVRRWMRANPDFEQQYNAARRQRADARSDRMDQIAQAVSDGKLHPDAAKVMLANERWQASKENVGRYGEKLDLDVATRATTGLVERPSVDWERFDIDVQAEPSGIT